MPEINLDLDPDLHARLTQWAQEQRRPLSALASDILAAAERVLANYDPEMSQSTRWIRMCRDGGCRLCDELEPLFAMGITKAPSYDRYGAIAKRIAPPYWGSADYAALIRPTGYLPKTGAYKVEFQCYDFKGTVCGQLLVQF